MRPFTKDDVGQTVLYRNVKGELKNARIAEVHTGSVGIDLNGAILQVTHDRLIRARKVGRKPEDNFPPKQGEGMRFK